MKLIGIDHVGISSDFDGGGGVDGWNGADETFNVTLELVRRGYTEPQIAKMWSGNLLRVLDEVQAVAKKMQQTKYGGWRLEVGISDSDLQPPTSDLQPPSSDLRAARSRWELGSAPPYFAYNAVK